LTKHHYFNVLHNIASDFHSRISGSRELKPANSPNSSQVFKIDQPEWDRILAMKVFNETCSEEPDRYVNRDILHAEIFHGQRQNGLMKAQTL